MKRRKHAKELAKMSREEKVLIYVIGLAEELKEAGILEGGPKVTKRGLSFARELINSDFDPAPEEMEAAIASLTNQ